MKTIQTGATLGIKETLDFYELADHAVDVLQKSKEDDGKTTVKDFPLFLQLPFKMADAFNGVDQVDDELRDLDEDEARVLEARNAKFIKNPRYAKLVRHLMLAAVEINGIIADRKN